MFFIFISLLSMNISHAGRFEGEPGFTRRTCDNAQVEACRQKAQIAVNECQSRVSNYAAQENIVSLDINSRKENLAAASAAMAVIRSQIQSAGAELQFLDELAQKTGSVHEFFPGSPALENFFSMDRISTEWDEKYPQQYRLKLKDQESELVIFSQKIAAQQTEIESEINSMLPQLAFLSGEKNRWQSDANIHARLWENGCRQQVCPNN